MPVGPTSSLSPFHFLSILYKESRETVFKRGRLPVWHFTVCVVVVAGWGELPFYSYQAQKDHPGVSVTAKVSNTVQPPYPVLLLTAAFL
jgi:hypothetical protein